MPADSDDDRGGGGGDRDREVVVLSKTPKKSYILLFTASKHQKFYDCCSPTYDYSILIFSTGQYVNSHLSIGQD